MQVHKGILLNPNSPDENLANIMQRREQSFKILKKVIQANKRGKKFNK